MSRLFQRTLIVCVFFSGWALLRVGQINITLADILFFICFGIVALQGRLTLTPFGGATPYWMIGNLLMLGGLFVSSLVNGDPLRWANIASQYFDAYVLIPILLASLDTDLTRKLPLAFVLGIVLSEIIGITATFFLHFHDVLGILGDGFITGNDRLGAMSGQPNPNGGAISFSMPMLIYAVRRKQIPLWMGIICGGILIWGLMLSASFTGFFATIMAVGCTLTLLGIRYVIRLSMVGMVAIGLFVASGAPLPAVFQERVGNAVSNQDIDEAGTFLNRAALIEEAWGLAEKTTFIGLGADKYRDFSQYQNPVHDLYLLMWTEGGCFALFGLMMLLGLVAALALAGMKRSREEGAMATSVAFVFLIYTVSYPSMYSREWVMPIMVALATVYARPGRREVEEAQPQDETTIAARI